MRMIDNFKEDMKKLQGYTTQEKIAYIRDYYIWHIVVILAVVVIVVSSIISAATKKDAVLIGMMLNAGNEGGMAAQALCEDFLQKENLDPKKFEVELNAGMIFMPENKEAAASNSATQDVLMARISGKLLDFVAGNYNAMLTLAYSDYFVDLSKVLTDEQIETYKDRILYMDSAVLEELRKAAESEDYSADIKIPDPKKPELMKTPVPILLSMAGSEPLKAVYPNTTEVIVFAVTQNYPNHQNLISFVDYLLNH